MLIESSHGLTRSNVNSYELICAKACNHIYDQKLETRPLHARVSLHCQLRTYNFLQASCVLDYIKLVVARSHVYDHKLTQRSSYEHKWSIALKIFKI